MHYLIIDTCVWIDLCRKYTKLRDKIADLVDRGQLVLIVPQVVLHEWERKKRAIVEQREASIRGQIKNARAIAQYLRQEEADDFTRILDGFQQRKDEIERLIRSEIEAIDDLLKHPSTITLEPADKVKLQAADLALAKKAPFRDTNSMADALIVLSALNYVTEQGLDNCIFVSSNTADFSSESDKTQIHPDLEPLFDDCKMKYCSNIGLTINQIEAGLVSDESIEAVERDIRIATLLKQQQEFSRAISEQMGRAVQQIAELAPPPRLSTTDLMKPFFEQQEEFSRAISEQMGRAVQQIAELAPPPRLSTTDLMKPFFEQQEEFSRAISEQIERTVQQIAELAPPPRLLVADLMEPFLKQQEEFSRTIGEQIRRTVQQIAELAPPPRLSTTDLMKPFFEQQEELSRTFREQIARATQQMAELARQARPTTEDLMKPFFEQQEELSRTFREQMARATQQMMESLRDQQEQIAQAAQQTAQLSASDTAYVGSKDGVRFHLSACTHARRILPENLIQFATSDEAVAKGYVPCGTCRP